MIEGNDDGTLRSELSALSMADLVDLVVDLCEDNRDAANFCRSRMGKAEPDWYRREIRRCVWPDMIEKEEFDFERGRNLVEAYRKATQDWPGTIDLMLHFVEQGNQCTLDYGDIDAGFYEELEEMFEEAVQALTEHPECLTEETRHRIATIRDETENIGWDYHDTLTDIAATVLPDDEDDDPEDSVPLSQLSKREAIARLKAELEKLREEV